MHSKRSLIIALIAIFTAVNAAGQEAQYTKNTADQTLRSNGRVNPSTLGMEMDLPLGSYPSRGMSLPLSLSYSSKQWRLQEERCGTTSNGVSQSWVIPRFSEDAAAGWTSSLSQPFIEYTGEMYRFQDDGEPLSVQDAICTPNKIRLADSYMKRLTVHIGGSSHELLAQDAPIPIAVSEVPAETVWDTTFYATDGSGVKYVQNSANGTYKLYLPDGSFYDFNATREYKSSTEFVYVRRADRLTDVHGNYVQFFLPNGSTEEALYPNGYWKDQLDRKFPVMLPKNNPTLAANVEELQQSFTMPGMSEPYVLKWKRLEGSDQSKSAFTDVTSQEPQHPGAWTLFGTTASYTDALFGSTIDHSCESSAVYAISSGPTDKFNPVVLTDIVLPNGASYRFTYNEYGEIERIDYPAGGFEKIFYKEMPALAELSGLYKKANRGVEKREIYDDGSDQSADTWNYFAAVSTNNYLTTVVAPDGTQIDRYMHRGIPRYCPPVPPDPPVYYGNRWGFDNVLAGRQYDEIVFNSDDDAVSRKITRWGATTTTTYASLSSNQYAKRNARVLTTESITYDGAAGVSAITKLEYANEDALGSPLNVTRTYEYAYKTVTGGSSLSPAAPTTVPPAEAPTLTDPTGNATLARVTETAYKTDQAYLDRNLVKLPIEVLVKDIPTGPVRSKSQIIYDDTTHLVVDDPAETAPGWSDPGTSVRGLATTAKAWYDIANDQFVQTHAWYNEFGNVRKTWDGNGNMSEVVYTDSFTDELNRNTFAFPTKTISPVASDGTHGINDELETSTVYEFPTGLVKSVKDANNATTTFEHVDDLLQPTKVIAANGHQTVTEYGAGTSDTTRFVKTRSQIDGMNWKESLAWYDGLGRTIRTQAIDSDGDVFVLSCYDNMGRLAKTTNPFRGYTTQTCATTGLEWTANTFDTAGRHWKTTTPDNAVVETIYTVATIGSSIGTVVTVKDQAGKLRRSITNSLGHLTRVDEPTTNGLGSIDSPNQPTFYSYDRLNNLTQVQQTGDSNEECGPSTTNCSQTRSFAYDSLSRLSTATNPESGEIRYTYDANGNLKTKVDARSIKTIYDYDALNRVKKRCYRVIGGTLGATSCATAGSETAEPNTPDVSYFYDLVTNAKGKLIKVTNGTGDNRSATEYVSFDILGRVTRSIQTIDNVTYGGGTDESRWMTYSYNLSGALVEQQYPSGRKVKNILDSDGELATVQSRKNPSHAYWNFANHFSYNAAGAVTSMQLGNGRWESTKFSNRLQPTQIALGKTAPTLVAGQTVYSTELLKLEYEYGDLDWNGSIVANSNNGNLAKQTITVAGVGATPGFTAVQNYDYDSLNRIQIASETLTPTTGTPEHWVQDFRYDRFGNRRFEESTTTTLPKECSGAVCPEAQSIVNPSINPANNRLNGYTFDAAGNTTRDADNRKFTYDAENKQVRVETVSGETVTGTVGEYVYDGDGRRVKKRAYENNVLTEETIFVYGAAGKLIGEYSNEIASPQDAKIAYLTNDHLGSPRINTDINGNVTTRHDYHSFGEMISTSQRMAGLGYSEDKVRKQFTGYERDTETELNFAEARMYANRLGRFTSPDDFRNDTEPDDSQSWNLYIYVRNKPLTFIDPTGKMGDYYERSTGRWIGHDNIDDDKAYIADIESESIDEDGTRTAVVTGRQDLGITNSEFLFRAGLVYGESTAFRSPANDDLADEMKGLAYVYTKNKTAFGHNNVQANLYFNTRIGDLTDKMRLANLAIINERLNGPDPSNGANGWDGMEQAMYPDSDKRLRNPARDEIIRKNDGGWSISDEHYRKWKANVGAGFQAPQKTPASAGRNKGKIRYFSTAVHGGTIFWSIK